MDSETAKSPVKVSIVDLSLALTVRAFAKWIKRLTYSHSHGLHNSYIRPRCAFTRNLCFENFSGHAVTAHFSQNCHLCITFHYEMRDPLNNEPLFSARISVHLVCLRKQRHNTLQFRLLRNHYLVNFQLNRFLLAFSTL